MMEDNEEEEDDDSYPGHGFPEYDDTKIGEEAEPAMRKEAKEEAADEPSDDLGWAIADAKRNCASDLERTKLQRMLEDHNCCTRIAKLTKKSWAPHLNCCNGRQRMVYLTRDLGNY